MVFYTQEKCELPLLGGAADAIGCTFFMILRAFCRLRAATTILPTQNWQPNRVNTWTRTQGGLNRVGSVCS